MAFSSTINWAPLIMGLFGGLALFLYGMDIMSKGLKLSAGDKMRTILSNLTSGRVIGLAVGVFVTMIIQSSSATTVMLVSFVEAGLMSFSQTLGVILGASIGTTITAQLVAFKVTSYALWFVTIGFLIKFTASKERTRYLGEAILGFGLLFYGMKLMSVSMEPLRAYGPFINLLRALENPLMGILFGMIFTALIQSSSAFLGIVIVLAQQNLIDLNAGIPLIIGTNIGTCITAVLASLGTARDAKRVAMAHVLFKVLGACLFILWIPYFATIVKTITKTFSYSEARQLANAHTIYNVGLALIFLPFTNYFSNFIYYLFPEKKDEEQKGEILLRHLDDGLISTPTAAINVSRTEIIRMVMVSKEMLRISFKSIYKDKKVACEINPAQEDLENEFEEYELEQLEAGLNFLEKKVGKYLIKICQQELSDQQASEIFHLTAIVRDLESIGDIIAIRLYPQVLKKISNKLKFSDQGYNELIEYHRKNLKQLSRIEKALIGKSYKLARKIVSKHKNYDALEKGLHISHMERVRDELKESLQTHNIHLELMDFMKQINVYTGNIARHIEEIATPEEGTAVEEKSMTII